MDNKLVWSDICPEKEILELERLAVEWGEKMSNATRDIREKLLKERLVEVGCCDPDSDTTDKLAELLVEIWEKQNKEEVEYVYHYPF